jgi:hypothetical protein
VVYVRADVSENRTTSIIKVQKSGKLVNANFVPSSLIISTLMMVAVHSSETSVLTRATRRNMPEDGIHRRDNLKSYIALTSWVL